MSRKLWNERKRRSRELLEGSWHQERARFLTFVLIGLCVIFFEARRQQRVNCADAPKPGYLRAKPVPGVSLDEPGGFDRPRTTQESAREDHLITISQPGAAPNLPARQPLPPLLCEHSRTRRWEPKDAVERLEASCQFVYGTPARILVLLTRVLAYIDTSGTHGHERLWWGPGVSEREPSLSEGGGSRYNISVVTSTLASNYGYLYFY